MTRYLSAPGMPAFPGRDSHTRRSIVVLFASTTRRMAHSLARPQYSALITPDGYSPKTDKGHARNVATAILYLAPSDASGVANTCADASAGCRASCLYAAGRGGFDPAVPAARIARTKTLKYNRAYFNARLIRETQSHRARAERKDMACAERLNGTSDLPWENFIVDADGHTMMTLFPSVQFYDYTKSARRALKHAAGQLPANYHLTFSRSETNEDDCRAVLAAGGSVAVVFKICDCRRPCKHEIEDGKYTYLGRPVVNGDHDDLRYLDAPNVVVGLKAKGPAKHDTTGFVVDIRDCELTKELARAA
jgi:hypothetical protein